MVGKVSCQTYIMAWLGGCIRGGGASLDYFWACHIKHILAISNISLPYQTYPLYIVVAS
jgi:hypothetical protein